MSTVNTALEAYIRDRAAREAALTAEKKDADVIAKAERKFKESQKQLLDALAKQKSDASNPGPPELLSRARFSRYYNAARERKALDGAEAELNQELKIADAPGYDGATILPWAILEPMTFERSMQQRNGVEMNADALTSLTDGDYDSTLAQPLFPVFASSDAAFLGINPVMVAPGATRVPVFSDVPNPVALAKGASQDSVAAEISSIELVPHELRSNVTYARRELVNYTGDVFEAGLRETFRRKLNNALDNAVIWSGDGTGENVRALYNSFAGTSLPANPGALVTFATGISTIAALVDGQYSESEDSLRIVCGQATYSVLRGIFASNTGLDVIQKIRDMGAAIKSSNRAPAVASNRQDALVSLSPEGARSYHLAVWEAVGLLRDEFGDSKSNAIRMSAFSFYDARAVRGSLTGNNLSVDGFNRIRYQVTS